MRRPERCRVLQSKRLLPQLKPWRYLTCQLMNWVQRLTRSGPHARRLLKESKSRLVAWSAIGNGHSFPARSENSCWTTRGCAMRCAGPCSIADRLARNIGVAQQARACSGLTPLFTEVRGKRKSAKFGVAICPALSRTPVPIGRGEHDLALSPAPNATFGARICYKLLRLATGSTSENSYSTHSGE